MMEKKVFQKIQENNSLSREIEKKLISILVSDYSEKRALQLLNELKEDDFYYNRKIYKIIQKAVQTQNNLATLFIANKVKISDFLIKEYYAENEIEKLISELKRVSLTRKFIEKTWTALSKAHYCDIDKNIATCVSDVSSLNLFEDEKVELSKGIQEYDKLQLEIAQDLKNGKKYMGLPTGFDSLDTKSEGLLPASLTILGGVPGGGKTSMAINIALNALEQNKRVIIFSLEMTRIEIISKLLALKTDLNPIRILKGLLNQNDANKIIKAKSELFDKKLIIYDNVNDYEKIKTSMLKEASIEKVDLFIIDYLQLISAPEKKDLFERMSTIPNELKTILAKKTNAPILAISQISNQDARSQDNEVGGYKGSGDIEYAANTAMKLVHSDSREERDMKKEAGSPLDIKCIITKQRHGMTGAVNFKFDGYLGKFHEDVSPKQTQIET